ncbi:MAG: 30S ribosomal protein S16 [Alphaproteobacteria bacterium]
MSVKIRLSRAGAKKRPYYKVVVADTRSPRDGRFIERIGSYNPMVPHEHPDRVKFDAERVKHWMSKGALPSDRVARLLAIAGLGEKPDLPKNQTKKHLPRAKTQEKMKAAAEAAEAAEKAKAEATAAEAEVAAAAPAAEEAPAT